MDELTQAFSVALMDPLTILSNKLTSELPNIAAAFITLIIGYFIAKIVAYLVLRFIEKTRLEQLVAQSGFLKFFNITEKLSFAVFFSKLSFYILMITFIMSAAEMLHLNVMADSLKVILLYLPNVFAALLVLLFGFYIANIAKNVIINGAKGMNLDYAVPLGKTAYGVIAIISISLSIGQLGIDTDLLNIAAEIFLVAIAASLALSLGLGTRGVSAQFIAGAYVRDIYEPEDRVEVDGIIGTVLYIGSVKTVIGTDEGKEISISNERLLKAKVIKG